MADNEGKFKVVYEIEDGYAGGARPQSFVFDEDGLHVDMTDEQIEGALYDAAHDDMLQKVGASINNRDEFMAWAKARIKLAV